MNKKFLSAILFGALMVTSTGTFVSCKDYDDDIDNINKELTEVKSQITALQTKIDAGKWITSVSSVTGGFTVAFSDGSSYTITNGKDGVNGNDGAAGEAGAPGTQWTISDDGFWVCNGEPTTVKAVGTDGAKGEPGEAGQQEVKRVDGKWQLWDAEAGAFVELEIPGTSANVPYYVADVNDPNNYVILYVSDKDGKNETSVRLPLNEGLAQINVLENNFNIAYSISKEGTAWPKWEGGSKAKPAKGEYMVGQSASSIIVQISPVSYDLSGKTVKAVNSKGEELPIKLGKVVPFTGVLSRTASATGLYEIPVEGLTVNDETVEAYGSTSAIASLVVNENVYSPFNGDFSFSLQEAYDARMQFGKYQINDEGKTEFTSWVKAKPGESVTIVPEKDNAGQLYDSYITMRDNAQAKADSIRYGVSFDGMTINFNDKAAGSVYFTVHYLNVYGKVYSSDVTVNFNEKTPEAEEVTSIASKKHVVTEVTKTAKQAFISDLKPYFDAMGAEKRIVWNAEYRGIELDGNPVEWIYEDPESGQTITDNLPDLVSGITVVDAEGKTTTDASKIAGIQVNFVQNYGSRLADIIKYGGEFTTKVNVRAAVKTGTSTDWRIIATIELPFTIEKPSDATLAAAYTFNPSYYLNKVTTVYGTAITKANIFSAGIVNGYKPVDGDAGKISVDGNGTITLTGGEVNKAYTLTGGKVTYAGVEFPIADFKVMFAASKNYTTVMPTGISIISGSGNAVTVKYGKAADKNDKNIYYRVDNIAGTQDNITSVTCEVEAKYAQYLTAISSNTDIVLTAISGDANKVSVATPVKVTLTITTSTGEEVKDTITVSLTPYPAQ